MNRLFPVTDAELSPESSVPVIVDAVRHIEGSAGSLDWARCIYFVVTADAPPAQPVSLLDQPRSDAWLYRVVGLAVVGVVTGPLPSSDPASSTPALFTSPQQLDQLITEIESQPELLVETDSLWVPAGWLAEAPVLGDQPGSQPSQSRPIERGDVYRLPHQLFAQLAHDPDAEPVHGTTLAARAGRPGIALSPTETAAMAAWGELQISEAQEQYPKDPALELKYK